MKLFFLALCLLFSVKSFAQNLPSNPKVGECYVRCREGRGELLEWKKIDCSLVKPKTLYFESLSQNLFSIKDEKLIDKKLVRILRKGFVVELISHFDSNASNEYNMKQSVLQLENLVNNLLQRGIKKDQFVLTAKGNLDRIFKCETIKSCQSAYSKNTRMTYRVVNSLE